MSRLTSNANLFHAVKELTWLVITALIIWAILYPITQQVYFIYWRINTVFIFVTLTYFRWTVTFKSLPFLRPAWVRFLLFTFNFTLFFYLMWHEQRLITLYDNFYTEDFGFPKVIMFDSVKQALFKYLYREMVLFGTGSLIMVSAFQFRLILSYWQYYKHQADNLLEN